MRKRVVVLFGGRSAEHEISCISARSVMEALDQDRYEVVPIGIAKDGTWRLMPAGPPAVEAGARSLPQVEPSGHELALGESTLTETGSIDVVFPVLHGPYGEDGAVQGFLETAGVPYVGAGVLGSALGMDKDIQKTVLRAAGIPVVDWIAVHEREWNDDREVVEARAQDLGYPLFSKPANLGSSVGIAKIESATGLVTAVEHAFGFSSKAVLEVAVDAPREIECAVLGNEDPTASLPGEIRPSNEFYDYSAKYLDQDSELIVPAELPPETIEEIQRMAVVAFKAIEAEGMARVDFFLDDAGRLVVNELNTIPGFTSISMYPKMWEASGLPYAQLLDRLIELAIERHARARSKKTSP